MSINVTTGLVAGTIKDSVSEIYSKLDNGLLELGNPAMGSKVQVTSSSVILGATNGETQLTLDWVSGITFPDGTTQTTAGGGGGGGGSYLPLSGGTMTGAITFGTAGQNIDVGSFDNGTGGSNGISLYCAVNYELNWQGGFLENKYNGSTYPIKLKSGLMFGDYPSGSYTEFNNNGFYWASADNSGYGEYTKQRFHIGTLGALNPVWIDASLNMGSDSNPSIQLLPNGATGSAMKIDGFGLTFPDGSTQVTATLGTSDQTLATTDDVEFHSVTLDATDSNGTVTNILFTADETMGIGGNIQGTTSNAGSGLTTSYQLGNFGFFGNSSLGDSFNFCPYIISANDSSSGSSIAWTPTESNGITNSTLTLTGSGINSNTLVVNQSGITFPDSTYLISAPVASTGTQPIPDLANDYPDEVRINIGGVLYAMPARIIP